MPTHIILGTGTNDVEKGIGASMVFDNLKKSAEELASTYPNAYVYVAQLPPMGGDGKCNEEIKDLNTLIREDLSENINVILHENITMDDMHDTKHVRIKSLGKLVKNMKDQMRKVLKLTLTDSSTRTLVRTCLLKDLRSGGITRNTISPTKDGMGHPASPGKITNNTTNNNATTNAYFLNDPANLEKTGRTNN